MEWDYFDHGLEIWDWWAKYDKAYQGFKDLQARWQSFDRKKGTISKQLFEIAREHGWKDATEEIIAKPYVCPDETKIPRRDFLYGHHLLRKTVSVTAAAGATGKSSKSVVDTLAMVTGRDLLGTQPSGQLRVLLINLEDDRDEMDRRFAAAMKHYQVKPEDLGNARLTVPAKGELKLKLAKQIRQGEIEPDQTEINKLIKYLRENEIDVVIIDPLRKTHRVAENDNVAMGEVIEIYEQVAEQANCAVLIVHHVRKGNGNETTVDSLRGAVSIVNAARSVEMMEAMTKGQGEDFGLAEGRYKYFFRAFSGKLNFAPPIDEGDWYERVDVQLYNGVKGAGDLVGFSKPGSDVTMWLGDHVGVITRWMPPEATEHLTPENIEAIKKAVAKGKWREDVRAGMWVGKAIEQVLGLDVGRGHQKGIE